MTNVREKEGAQAGDEWAVNPEPRRRAAVFVDRFHQQWIVQDPQGQFWTLPVADNPWHHRRPFDLNDDTQLEPIPAHYMQMLGLPF